MNYSYKLEEEDYHTHLLFTISKSSSAIKTRARIRLLMTISLLLFAFISYGNNSGGQTVYFFSLAVLAFFLMPLYTRWSYKKTYLKHVRNYYKDRMSEPTTLNFENDSISIFDSQGESSINFSELDEINDLADYYFLKVKSGQSIILPKKQIENQNELLNTLKKVSSTHSISWNDEKNWIWK
jgi:hypothetical protein